MSSAESSRSHPARSGASTLSHDVRFALRSLRRTPGITAVIVATLALGIGATTAMFSVADAALFRPLPFRDAERIVILPDLRIPIQGSRLLSSRLDINRARGLPDVFESVGAYAVGQLNLSGDIDPIRVRVAEITPNLLSILGVAPRIGRRFLADEERTDGADVAILSHAIWQRVFGADDRITGKRVELNGRSFEVVGVMPARFAFPSSSEIWIPLTVPITAPRAEVFQVLMQTVGVAKLAPDVTPSQASARLRAVMIANGAKVRPGQPGPGIGMPMREFYVGDVRPRITIVTALVLLVVLMACVNVSGLLLARSIGRRRELAIRKAIGAGRGRLIRQLLTESFVLAGAGAVLGVAVAVGVMRLFSTLTPSELTALTPPVLDVRVLTATLITAVFTAAAFGVLPSLVATRQSPAEALKSGSGGGSMHRGARQLNTALVAAEVALAVVLLVASGLMLKSLSRLFAVETGMRTERIVTGRVTLPNARYATPDARLRFFDAVTTALTRTPGIQAAAAVNFLPLGRDKAPVLWIEARSRRDSAFAVGVESVVASSQYFATMGIRLLAGRLYDARDASAHVVVINESLAKKWPGGAIGGHVTGGADATPREIIGVVNDVKTTALDGESNDQVYVPFEEDTYAQNSIVVRGTLSPNAMLARLRAVVREIDPHQALSDLQPMTDIASMSVAPRRASSQLTVAFGAFALVLAGIGVFGLLAFTVSERMPELGIRVALGAQSNDVIRLVLGDALRVALIGATIGSVAAFEAAKVLRSLLFEVSSTDPLVFVAAPLVILVVAMLATLQPGRRAIAADPLTTMRAE